jgi:hypothetical protein
MWLHPTVPEPQEMDGFLYKYLIRVLEPIGGTGFSIIAFALVYLQAILLNNFTRKYKLMQTPSYLVGMSYLLITSMFPEWQTLSSPVIVNTCMIGVMFSISELFNTQKPKTILFNIGLMIGLASFFYYPAAFFLLLMIFGLILTRPFRINEWFIGLLGSITPYYFALSYLYLTDQKWKYDLPNIQVVKPFFIDSRWSYLAIGLISILFIVGFSFVRIHIRRQLVHTRKIWSLIMLYMLIAFFVPFINVNDRFDYWILVAVPIACWIGAAFLYPQRKWFGWCFHWGLVAISIVMGYFLNG